MLVCVLTDEFLPQRDSVTRQIWFDKYSEIENMYLRLAKRTLLPRVAAPPLKSSTIEIHRRHRQNGRLLGAAPRLNAALALDLTDAATPL